MLSVPNPRVSSPGPPGRPTAPIGRGMRSESAAVRPRLPRPGGDLGPTVSRTPPPPPPPLRSVRRRRPAAAAGPGAHAPGSCRLGRRSASRGFRVIRTGSSPGAAGAASSGRRRETPRPARPAGGRGLSGPAQGCRPAVQVEWGRARQPVFRTWGARMRGGCVCAWEGGGGQDGERGKGTRGIE